MRHNERKQPKGRGRSMSFQPYQICPVSCSPFNHIPCHLCSSPRAAPWPLCPSAALQPAHKPQINGLFSLLSSHSALQVLQPISREGSCQWQCQQHCMRFPREFVHSPALDNALRNLSWTKGKKHKKKLD